MIGEALGALRGRAFALAVEPGDLMLQTQDGGGVFTVPGVGDGELGFKGHGPGLGRDNLGLQCFDIFGKLSAHGRDRSIKCEP